MAECICFPAPPSMRTTHYGAIEPASMLEPNPECREHFPKRVQECKDCEGLGEWAYYGKAYFCKTCDGTGEIERTGPYRLIDGTWSDEVNREKRIADQHSGDECISRMYVWQFHSAYYDKSMWAVARSEPYTDQDFHKFAEAIAYADRMARTNQGENND